MITITFESISMEGVERAGRAEGCEAPASRDQTMHRGRCFLFHDLRSDRCLDDGRLDWTGLPLPVSQSVKSSTGHERTSSRSGSCRIVILFQSCTGRNTTDVIVSHELGSVTLGAQTLGNFVEVPLALVRCHCCLNVDPA